MATCRVAPGSTRVAGFRVLYPTCPLSRGVCHAFLVSIPLPRLFRRPFGRSCSFGQPSARVRCFSIPVGASSTRLALQLIPLGLPGAPVRGSSTRVARSLRAGGSLGPSVPTIPEVWPAALLLAVFLQAALCPCPGILYPRWCVLYAPSFAISALGATRGTGARVLYPLRPFSTGR